MLVQTRNKIAGYGAYGNDDYVVRVTFRPSGRCYRTISFAGAV